MPTSHRFRQPLTISETINKIKGDEFLLPGIQRSFVWKPTQIYMLFDSLLRGYPLGSILAWQTRPMDHSQLSFRRLVVHADDGGSTEPQTTRPPRTSTVYAILDGQQRLTAFNIGLRGSSGSKRKQLFLNLNAPADDPGAEQNQYSFEFRLATDESGDEPWFPVADSLGLGKSRASLDAAIRAVGLEPTSEHRRTLSRLVRAVNDDPVLRVQVEAKADLDRVLNVFARTNTGGTKLTYVDLLVSTATARWKRRDARAEFEGLRVAMNAAGEGFRFSHDRLVKAGLVLLDAPETKFHIDSFTKGNKAQQLEAEWDTFTRAMTTAARTLASFGLSAGTLRAENVLIPVAYYAKHRKLQPTYATAASHAKDRRLVAAFVARTLLQRRYWTGAVDPILVETRKVIRQHGSRGFPLAEIEDALSRIGNPIDFDEDMVDELCLLRYGDRRTLLLLRMLFADVPRKEGFDKDHIFPISKFEPSVLRRAGFAASRYDNLRTSADQLPNLHLLDKIDNRGKGAKMPRQWLASLDVRARKRYTEQFVVRVPADLDGFEGFWDTRYDKLRGEIEHLLQL